MKVLDARPISRHGSPLREGFHTPLTSRSPRKPGSPDFRIFCTVLSTG